MAEKSLRDLIERQIYEQKDTTDAVDALNKQFTQYFKVLERQKLPSEEKRRERGLFGRMLGGGSDNTASKKDDGGSIFGGLFAGVFKSLSGPLGFILKPLRLLARLLIRGGPIGIAIGLLYTVFKDIGDNPKFQESLEKIKETWQLVKSTFTDLKDYFVELSADPGIRSAVEMIKNWFIRLKDNIQDFVIDSLFGISDVITGTIGTIKGLLTGDFSGAWESLKTAVMGLVNILDSAVTNILEAFGVDFGENGTFIGAVGGLWDRLTVKLLGMWNDATTWISNSYDTVISSVKQTVGDLGQALENFIVDSWNWITGWIPDPAKIAASIKQRVMDLIPDFIKDTVEFKTVTASKYRLTDDMRAEQALMQQPLVGVTATQPTIAAEQSRLRIEAANRARAGEYIKALDTAMATGRLSRGGDQVINIGQVGDNIQSTTAQAARAVAAAPLGSAVNTSLIQKRAMQGGSIYMMGNPLLHLLN
jgi:hypothetical protein